jgi:hypothetical protein
MKCKIAICNDLGPTAVCYANCEKLNTAIKAKSQAFGTQPPRAWVLWLFQKSQKGRKTARQVSCLPGFAF